MSDDNLLQVLMHRITDPLVPEIGEAADKGATAITTPRLDESRGMAMLKGFGAGALSGAGHLVSDQTSPVNIATMMFGGTLGRGALKGVKLGSRLAKGATESAGIGGLIENAPALYKTLGETAAEFVPKGGDGVYNAISNAASPLIKPMSNSVADIANPSTQSVIERMHANASPVFKKLQESGMFGGSRGVEPAAINQAVDPLEAGYLRILQNRGR